MEEEAIFVVARVDELWDREVVGLSLVVWSNCIRVRYLLAEEGVVGNAP